MTQRRRFENPAPDDSELSLPELESLIDLQSQILKSLLTSRDLDALLEQLCILAEQLSPGAVATIMLYCEDRQQLFVHTAPSIPEEAIAALNGLNCGEGSCGNAVYHNEEMFVSNTFEDARWENLLDFAETYNLRSCWSHPIRNAAGDPIGSFALSGFSGGVPSNFQRRLLQTCTFICGIIFQRKTSEQESRAWQQQLQTSEQNLERSMNSIADGVISTDIEGRILVFNRVASQLTGFTEQQAIGQPLNSILQIIDSRSRKILFDSGLHRDADRTPVSDGNTILLDRKGHRRHIALEKTSLKNADDAHTGILLSFRDVSEHRATRISLTKIQQQNHTIIENSADGLFLHDDDGRILNVNQAACESLGYSRDELLQMTIADIEKGLNEVPSFREFAASLGFDRSTSVDGVHQRKDGSRFPVEVRVRRFLSSDQALTIAVARDITERMEAEKELVKTRKLESIGLLAGGIAHDFNNLLGIIRGYIDLSARSLGDSTRAGEFLQKANEASGRAAGLTQQLMTFSRGGEPVRKAADIAEVVRDSTEFSLPGSNLQVNFHPGEALWKVDIDSSQISQVMQNLAINARQAMPGGGTLDIRCENEQLTSRISRHEIPPGRYVKITIGDTGPGIPDSIIDRIFDPYFTTRQDGSGLGLALSYSIIQKHRGYLNVTSVIDHGSTFTIHLPASETVAESEQPPQESLADTSFRRILVMDDDEMIRGVCAEMLQNLGYEVLQAENGEQAIDAYREARDDRRPVDMIIMDLTITRGMGGKDAIRAIQNFDPDACALVSSGYSNDPVMANFADYGFSGALAKPYTQGELEAAIGLVTSSTSENGSRPDL